jgi:transcriptional/translational regulatory protein YebC/TACO1
VTLSGTERTEVEEFLNAVDQDDDVQNVYAGLAT